MQRLFRSYPPPSHQPLSGDAPAKTAPGFQATGPHLFFACRRPQKQQHPLTTGTRSLQGGAWTRLGAINAWVCIWEGMANRPAKARARIRAGLRVLSGMQATRLLQGSAVPRALPTGAIFFSDAEPRPRHRACRWGAIFQATGSFPAPAAALRGWGIADYEHWQQIRPQAAQLSGQATIRPVTGQIGRNWNTTPRRLSLLQELHQLSNGAIDTPWRQSRRCG